MGIRFRRRVKLFPGVTLNFSKSGISTTIGVRGASVNFGRKGTYVNTGIPGTGIYSREKVGDGSSSYNTTPYQNSSSTASSKSSNLFVFFISVILVVIVFAALGKSVDPVVYVIAGVIAVIVFIAMVAKKSTPTAEVPTSSPENTNNIPSGNDIGTVNVGHHYTFDPLFDEAARIIFQNQECSVSLLQNRLIIGVDRAGRIIDQLEMTGVIRKYSGLYEISVKTSEELEKKLQELNKIFG